MSAYVIVEMAVKDAAAKDRYSAAAGPIIKEHGGACATDLRAAVKWARRVAGAAAPRASCWT